MDRSELSEAICDLAEAAGREILAVYAESQIQVRTKADASPVTAADERSEALIIGRLAELAPEIPIVAEESVAQGRIPDISGGRFFLVDPIDGTKEFISRNGEFTVNIALIENREPTLGVVHLPALGETYWSAPDRRAWRRRLVGDPEPIYCREPGDGLVVVASRSHRDKSTDEFLERFPVDEVVSAGSSLKLCRVAEGAADMYPRLGRTMEWDIAAGHAVLATAGGQITTLAGAPLQYGKPGLDNPHFVAWGFDPKARGFLT